MSVKVKIPPLLRTATRRQKVVEVEGGNVADCLDKMGELFPGTKSHLFDENGELKSSVTINVNGKDVHSLSGLKTALEPEDVVNILLAHPAMG